MNNLKNIKLFPDPNLLLRSFIRLIFIIPLTIALNITTSSVIAVNTWSPQERVPVYDDSTEPPYMVADQNQTVHAFASQWVGEGEGNPEVAIVYNQWSLERGWTVPIDILLSPLNHFAWVQDAHLDQTGTIHIIFFGGNNIEANIYYSRAPAIKANDAKSWSIPVLAGGGATTNNAAAFIADDHGRFYILYGGNRDGNGLYAASSIDGGDTWTTPTPIYSTNDDKFPYGLQMYLGQSDWIHAIWNVVTPGGQGREIYYSRMKVGDTQWSEPIKLAEAQTGYGTNTPTIIEHKGNVFAIYNMTPKITMRRSEDGGQTWSNPVVLFSRHVGVNGILSLVIDSSDNLHLFFGQRIPGIGSPDIHGMWHSIWLAGYWSEPEAVVSGPAVMSGEKSFDPYNARAVVSQGNVILVTWRTDPGNGIENENGVWYSYLVLDTPELPIMPLPIMKSTKTSIPTTATEVIPKLSLTVKPESVSIDPSVNGSTDLFLSSNPAELLIVSMIPVCLIISMIMFRFFFVRRNRQQY